MLDIFDDVGKLGIIKDVDPKKLPASAWSGGQNVRFNGFTAERFSGMSNIFDPPSVDPYNLFFVTSPDSTQHFVYTGLAKVFMMDTDAHVEITRGSSTASVSDYAATAAANWNGGVLHGILILNNGVDVPQSQVPAEPTTRLTDLANWPAAVRAAVVRPFKNYLVALDITKTTTRYRQLVKWSAQADPGAVPPSWDETDPALDAGELPLSETNGAVVDCLPLRDVNVIYKEDSVWAMQLVGTADVFRFYQLFKDVGLLARRCVTAFDSYHVFIGSDLDVYVHDGQELRSIANDRWKEYIAENIDTTNFARSFVVRNPPENEIWICICETGQSFPNRALVWNWRKDTWGERDLPAVAGGATGVAVTTAGLDTWASVTETWTEIMLSWSESGASPPNEQLLLASPTNGLIQADNGSAQFGEGLPAFLERQGIWQFAVPQFGKADLQSVKFVRRVRFRLDSPEAGSVMVKVAVHMDLADPLVWTSATASQDGTTEISIFRRGRFVSVRIESTGVVIWELHSIEIDADPGGKY